MTGAYLVDANLFHESRDPVAKVGWTEASAVAAEEQSGFVGQMRKQRACFGKIAFQPPRGSFADWQQPALAALALADEQSAGGGIIIASLRHNL